MRMSLPENHVNILRVAFLQFLLQVTAAMLIFAQRINFVDEAFKLDVCETIDFLGVSEKVSEERTVLQTFPIVVSLLDTTALHLMARMTTVVALRSLSIQRIRAIRPGCMEHRAIDVAEIDVSITTV